MPFHERTWSQYSVWPLFRRAVALSLTTSGMKTPSFFTCARMLFSGFTLAREEYGRT